MALRSGYYGLKNATKKILEKLAVDTAGMKIIKSFGDGLNLTNAGKLNMTAATASKIGGIKVGDGLSIEEGVLSVDSSGGMTIKTLTYTGDGEVTSTIDFSNEDADPTFILGIYGESNDGYYMAILPFPIGVGGGMASYAPITSGSGGNTYEKYSFSDHVLSVSSSSADNALNYSGKTYTVYYI